MLRIAIDATPLSVETGGIARYTRELSFALAVQFPHLRLLLTSDQPFSWMGEQPGNIELSPGPRSGLNRRWWSWGLPRQLQEWKADVFIGTDFAVPWRKVCRNVMVVHDLSPWSTADWARPSIVRRRAGLQLRTGRADLVLTPSEAVRSQAIRHFGLEPAKVEAVALGVSSEFRPVRPRSAVRPYFLSVGTLEPRKNLPLLLDAWQLVGRQHDADLLFIGRSRDDSPFIREEHRAGIIPEAELPAWYSGASALCFPSFYEGFGLPALEAMSCGCPVLCSTDPALREVTGGAALYLPMDDPLAWAKGMEEILGNKILAARLRLRGLARAAEFSWTRTAGRTLEVITP